MTKAEYAAIESHMLSLMKDSAHDCQHICRVLYYTLQIAKGTDADVLVAAALLHDIGRVAKYADHSVDHATAGAAMAREFSSLKAWRRRYSSTRTSWTPLASSASPGRSCTKPWSTSRCTA